MVNSKNLCKDFNDMDDDKIFTGGDDDIDDLPVDIDEEGWEE